MKTRFVSTLISFAVLLLPGMLEAQDYSVPEIKISTEKVRYEGKIYYSHIVKEKQTLFSISKVYAVPIEDIFAANPGLEQNGLKTDCVILIPAENQDEPDSKAAKKQKKEQQDTVSKLVKEEPSQHEGESVNHRVKWYEDIESIAASYGISVTAIMKANGLQDKNLKPRQILVIPIGSDIPDEPLAAGAVNPAEGEIGGEFNEIQEEIPAKAPQKDSSVFERKHDITIMLMLPVKASSGGNGNYMDFYSGALLAAKDKSEEGIHINLNVIDVASGIPEINAGEYEAADVIIGPVSTDQIETVLSRIALDKYVVSPMDPKVETLISKYPNLIQAPTPASSQLRDMFRWISEDMKEEDRTIVIYEKGSKEAQESSEINTMIDESNLNVGKLSYGILEGRDQLGHLANLMNKEAANRVVIASEKETFVNDVVRNINLMIHDGYNVILYSPSRIKSFDTIEVDNLHNANTHISMTYNVNYDNKKVQSFLMKYRALYKTEPGAFSFQGYDMISLFSSMIAEYGERWPEMLPGEKDPQLHENYNFYRCDNGGYLNKAVIRAVYDTNYGIQY